MIDYSGILIPFTVLGVCMVSEWVVYEMAPVDLWLGAITVAEVVKDLSQYGEPGVEQGAGLQTEAEHILESVIKSITQDVELRNEPYIVTMPLASQWKRVGYAYKLHNKGITYLAIKVEYETVFDAWFRLNEGVVTKKWPAPSMTSAA